MKHLAVMMALAQGLLAQSREGVGWLSVRTDPPGAVIVVDTATIGPAPLARHALTSGRHVVKVFAPSPVFWDGLMYAETLHVGAGDELEKSYELGSSFSVVSSPSGARVLYEGKEMGTTPLLIRSATRLKGEVSVEAPGFLPATLTLSGDGSRLGGFVNLAHSPEGSAQPVSDVVLEVQSKQGVRAWAPSVSAGSMLVSGIVAALYKDRANKQFDKYVFTKNPSSLESTHKYDRRSAVAFVITQISFAVLTYYLLSE